MSRDQTRALLERLDEQARMEREQGVAWLSNGGRGGNLRDSSNFSPKDGTYLAPEQFGEIEEASK